ncbi:hypothetical protein ACJMK2_008880, partial [Sinanodonta woodiana]
QQKGTKGFKTSTPAKTPGPAATLETKLEEPPPTTQKKGKVAQYKKAPSEDQILTLCNQLGTELADNRKKAKWFIEAVSQVGFRTLQTSQPAHRQWHQAVRFLRQTYPDFVREWSVYDFQLVASHIAELHQLPFPKVID